MVNNLRDIRETQYFTSETNDLYDGSEPDNPTKAATSLTSKQPSSRCCKRVRFNSEPPQIIPNILCFDEDQIRKLWFTSADYEAISQTVKGIAKQIRRHPRMTIGLDEAYKRTEKIVDKLDDEESTLKVMKRLSLDSGLLQWCAHGHSCRGLERIVSRLHSTSRSRKEASLTEMILDCCPSSFDDDEQENWRHQIEKITRTYRIFARMIGEADAVAVTRQNTYMRRWSDLGSRTTDIPIRRIASHGGF